MGQAAAASTSAGHDWNATLDDLKADVGAAWQTAAREKPYEKVPLLQRTLERADNMVFDRVSLTEKLKFDHCVRLDNAALTLRVAIKDDGTVIALDQHAAVFEALRHEYKLLELTLPGLADAEPDANVQLRGGKDTYTVRVCSDECPFLVPIIRRCPDTKSVVDVILQVLSAGAESVNLTLCHQMLELEFDKVDVLQEQGELSGGSSKVITTYLWVRMLHFKLTPRKDLLQPYFEDVKKSGGKANRDHIVRALRRTGEFSAEEIDRFLEGTGGKLQTGPKTDRYLRMMVNKAKERPFQIHRCGPDFVIPQQSAQSVSTEASTGEELPIAAVVQQLTEEIRRESVDHQEWTLLVGWEPVQIKTVAECLHEAQRCKVMEDEAGYIHSALRAVEITAKKDKTREGSLEDGGKKKERKEALRPLEVDSILSASKTMLDAMVEDMFEGKMSRERFEERYVKAATTIMDFLETNLLPTAKRKDEKDRIILCLRTLADYYRYLHVFIPGKRDNVSGMDSHYKECTQMACNFKDVPPFNLTALTACVNRALFYAEVERRYDLAARVCRESVASRRRHLKTADLKPAQIFNWHLIGHNLAAFETFIVVMMVFFAPEDLAAHEAIEPREPDFELATSRPSSELDSAAAVERKPASVPQFSCLGARERVCIDRMRRWQEPEVPQLPPPVEVVPDGHTRAVFRWLRSRPMYRWNAREDSDSDDEKASGAAANAVTQVRWVNHMEQKTFRADAAESSSSSSSEEEDGGAPGMTKTKSRERTTTISHDVKKFHRQFKSGSSAEPMHSFCLSCAVRVNHSHLQGNEWQRKFERELSEIVNGEKMVREVHITIPDELADLFDCMDAAAGIVLRCNRVADAVLYPGDTLLLEGPLAGCDLQRAMQLLRGRKAGNAGSQQAPLPMALKFLRGMQIAPNGIKVLSVSPYAEVHHNFVGFRDDCNLRPKTNSLSFVKMAGDFRKLAESAAKFSKGGKVAPQRLRNLSARRNPTKAGTTGCD